MKYNLTSDLIFFRPVIKVLYIYIYKAIFNFKLMGLNLTSQAMWVARVRVILFTERVVIGSQCPGNFLLVSVFLMELKNGLATHS